MTYRTIDLSGQYKITALDAGSITLESPEVINSNWLYVDLDGAGTTGYAQNVNIIIGAATKAVSLGGSYAVTAVTPTSITLDSPETSNADWGFLHLFPDAETRLLSAHLSTTTNGNWIGPFIVEATDTTLLVANFVAMQGLYKDDGKKQTAFPITMELEVTPVDSADAPRGAAQTFSTTIPGNSSGRDMRASTLVCELAMPGRSSVRSRRTTPADYNFKGTVVDEVKWQDLYGLADVPVSDFGNVTTVHSRTYATEGALNVKERKLNMLVTRHVPIRAEDGAFGASAATKNAADIFVAACRDPYIGGRPLSELDLASIYDAVAEAVSYFGSADAGEFCHTFDDDQTSFEETGQTIAQAVFSTAYRQGSKIMLAFERATEDSTLLFNHRNKVPGSEKRTVRFGNLDDNDGVELTYTAPEDDAPLTIYLPADRSARKPRSVKMPGVRSHRQARWQAWRIWSKIRFQNVAVEMTTLQEAATVVRNERVLIADNTRPDTQDGQVEGQDGLELELSQPVEFAGGAAYTIFLQLPDGSIQGIPVAAGSSPYHVALGAAPRTALAIGDDLYAPATFQIVRNDSPREAAFLIADKEAQDNFTYTVKAINYSSLYYFYDQLAVWLDFENAYQDAGPWHRDGVPAGGASIVVDTTRGHSHQGGAGTSVGLPSFAPPTSYTKAAWLKRTDLSVAGGTIIASANEAFGFTTGDLVGGHGSTAVSAAWPAAGAWHHAALTFDSDEGHMALYIDGALVDEAAGVAAAAGADLTALVALNGRADDLRLVRRAFSATEVRDLYRASRL